MPTVRQRTASGTYVFETERYWDENQQKYKEKRKSIGKIDPETGLIVPAKGKRGRKPKIKSEINADEFNKLNRQYNRSEERVAVLRNFVKELKKEIAEKDVQNQQLSIQNERMLKTINIIRSAVAIGRASLIDDINPNSDK